MTTVGVCLNHQNGFKARIRIPEVEVQNATRIQKLRTPEGGQVWRPVSKGPACLPHQAERLDVS